MLSLACLITVSFDVSVASLVLMVVVIPLVRYDAFQLRLLVP